MPAWPSPLQTPDNHASPQLQPDLYLQLSQILEWEIWNHNQTRGGLCLELARRTELEAQVCRLNQELAQWQESNRIAYGALDEHRAENSNLKLDVEALTDELRHLREQVQPMPRDSPPPSNHNKDKKVADKAPQDSQLPKIEKDDADSWRLGFIRDIEEYRSSFE
ncbi:unnamed protein product [Alternaria alternata]